MDFTRSEENTVNAALNYGYSIILSAFNREIVAHGYLTQLGIFHDTKLHSALEHKALLAENYTQTGNLLVEIERYVLYLSEELPFDVNCQRLAIGSIIKAVSPEIDDTDKSVLEKIFAYMELVRELDRDRLFIMVNMRSYFTDEDMQTFAESVNLHGFRVLLLESSAQSQLKNTKRYIVDEDLCEI